MDHSIRSAPAISQLREHETPTGLILDASRGTKSEIKPRKPQNATILQRFLTPPPSTSPPTDSLTALAWARQSQAPLIGHLDKLGQHVQVYKRRFFVLMPATHLYYFLSPHDTEPRGCLELQQSQIERISDLQFQIRLPDTVVHLEARTASQADEWCTQLHEQRIEFVRHELETSQETCRDQQETIRRLQDQIEQLQLVQQERDGLVNDVAHYRDQVQQLDDACGHIRRQVVRYLQTSQEQEETARQEVDGDENEEARVNEDGNEEDEPDENDCTPISKSSLQEDEQEESELDLDNIPGQHFTGLVNALQTLQDTHRVAATEASTALQDSRTATTQLEKLQTRMIKAETKLCALWQENCTLRQDYGQKKRECTALIKECKQLRKQQQQQQNQEVLEDKDAERLIQEVQDSIVSSIKLHEQCLSSRKEEETASNRNLLSLFDNDDSSDTSDTEMLPFTPASSSQVDSTATHPLHQLDLSDVESVSSSRPSLVESAGQPTSRLSCVLQDVPSSPKVYDITFYSRKIGLQFIRVPATTSSSGGLLNHALTPKKGTPSSANTPTIEPSPDAVLVCGFAGCTSATRPPLGARLIAFEGTLVELGAAWTFSAIRHAIQAQSRPLRLTFRNDALSVEQRAMLTKACAENKEAERTSSKKPATVTPLTDAASIQSALTVDTIGGWSTPVSFSSARSEASSSIVSTLFGNKTPKYLQSGGIQPEDTPQHQEYQADLL